MGGMTVAKKILIDGMSAEISNMMKEYHNTVSSDIKDCCRKVAKETATRLRKESPERSGKYRKSWKSTVISENSTGVQIAVHAGRYQLNHLLENGHAKRGGGRVEAIPHIKPLEEKAAGRLMEEIERIL